MTRRKPNRIDLSDVSVATLPCSDAEHRIQIRNNHVRLLDHPQYKRELLLAEFGEPCPCIQLLRMWRRKLCSETWIFSDVPSAVQIRTAYVQRCQLRKYTAPDAQLELFARFYLMQLRREVVKQRRQD